MVMEIEHVSNYLIIPMKMIIIKKKILLKLVNYITKKNVIIDYLNENEKKFIYIFVDHSMKKKKHKIVFKSKKMLQNENFEKNLNK